MTDYLWDGEMDCDWEGLNRRVIKTSKVFKTKMLETVSYAATFLNTKELINAETLNRFVDLTRLLSDNLEMGYQFHYEDLVGKNDNAYKLNSWILLGSLTECALQMFLAFYIEDYENSEWQQWDLEDEKYIKKLIYDAIDSLIGEKKILPGQGKSLKDAIKDKIKEHSTEHLVQKIMLDEIIKYYESMELLGNEELDYIRKIQKNRNGIHSFESKFIGTWNELKECVRFWCYILEWILDKLPEIPDCL